MHNFFIILFFTCYNRASSFFMRKKWYNDIQIEMNVKIILEPFNLLLILTFNRSILVHTLLKSSENHKKYLFFLFFLFSLVEVCFIFILLLIHLINIFPTRVCLKYSRSGVFNLFFCRANFVAPKCVNGPNLDFTRQILIL